jgi:hypothetical protein
MTNMSISIPAGTCAALLISPDTEYGRTHPLSDDVYRYLQTHEEAFDLIERHIGVRYESWTPSHCLAVTETVEVLRRNEWYLRTIRDEVEMAETDKEYFRLNPERYVAWDDHAT